MRKVMTIVGTRPELIKMSRVIAELDAHTDHILVHSGQNFDYELNKIFFDEMEIRKPDYFLDVAKENTAETIAEIISKSDEVLEKESPEALMLYGDTNTCLAAITAKRRKIPIFHMEAGNRCFDQRVPEEINRKIIDHISDINMVLTDHARTYLLREGISPETVIKTGSHMPEVLEYYKENIDNSNALSEMNLEKGKYFLISAHREENVDTNEKVKKLVDVIEAISNEYGIPIIVSTHPRTRKMLEKIGFDEEKSKARYLNPFGFLDYIKLQQNALCVLSDSGTLTEEAAILGLPAIMIREAHERPEGMDSGVTVMSALEKERIKEAIDITISQKKILSNKNACVVSDYKDETVSRKIVKIVTSYIDYVNRTVWYRS